MSETQRPMWDTVTFAMPPCCPTRTGRASRSPGRGQGRSGCTGQRAPGTLPGVTIAEEATSTDTAEQAEFRAEVKAFLAANAKPRLDSSPWAVNVHTSEDEARESFEEGCRWQRTLFDNHLAGLTYPVELGGRGGAPWMESIYREEVAAYDVSSGFIAATMAMLLPTLMKHATDEQKAYYV